MSSNIRKFFLLTFVFFLLSSLAWSQSITAVRPWLGVAIEKGEKGVRVKNALPDTPAQKAGIMAGDEVLTVAGRAVHSPEEMIAEIGNKGVGFTVKIEFLRKGVVLSKDITLVIMPDMLALIKKKLLNRPVPDFEAVVVQGKKTKFQMKNQIGRVTILEFWATWCPACNAAVPRLLQFAKEFEGKIDIVSLTTEETPAIKKFLGKVETVLKKDDNPIMYLQNTDGKVSNEFMASSIPMFVLIDKKGVVVDLDLGTGSVMENIFSKAKTLL